MFGKREYAYIYLYNEHAYNNPLIIVISHVHSGYHKGFFKKCLFETAITKFQPMDPDLAKQLVQIIKSTTLYSLLR